MKVARLGGHPQGLSSSEQHDSKLSSYSQLKAEQTPNLAIKAGPPFLQLEGRSFRVYAAFSLPWTPSILLKLVLQHST